MTPITTSFQRPSSSSSVVSARQQGTCSPSGAGGLLTSSLGRRPAVACQPAPSCGVVTPESGPFHLRRNSFTTAPAFRQRPVSSTPDECKRPATGYDVTNDTGSDVVESGESSQCSGQRGFRQACNGTQAIVHEHCRFGITSLFLCFATRQCRQSHYVFGLSVRRVRLFVRSFVRTDLITISHERLEQCR